MRRVRTISRKGSAIEAIPASLGSFLSGFALGEGSFMVVCRIRGGHSRKLRDSRRPSTSRSMTAFRSRLFRETLGLRNAAKAPATAAGTGRSIDFSDIRSRIVPFFERFPLVGRKATGLRRASVKQRSCLSKRGHRRDQDYLQCS